MRLKLQGKPYIGLYPIGSVIGTYEVSDDFMRDFKINLISEHRDNYNSMLIRLITKADQKNLAKLSQVYPAEVYTVWAYHNILDFYKQVEDK